MKKTIKYNLQLEGIENLCAYYVILWILQMIAFYILIIAIEPYISYRAIAMAHSSNRELRNSY